MIFKSITIGLKIKSSLIAAMLVAVQVVEILVQLVVDLNLLLLAVGCFASPSLSKY